MVRVIAAGHVNWDVTLRVDALPERDGEARILGQRRSGGGSAANVAAALAGFDVPVGVVGSVGDDDHGLLARRELREAGVDCSHLREVADATSVKYLVVTPDGEVMVLGNDGANEAVAPDDVDAGYVRSADHLHLTSQRPDTAARLAEVAVDAGLTVSFDPGRRLDDRDFSDALALADVVFVNDRESRAVLDERYDHPAEGFADRVLVVKHGGDGAAVHAPGGTYEHPGFEVDAVDTTGAGDAFAAGFLAVLADGRDREVGATGGSETSDGRAGSAGRREAPSELRSDESPAHSRSPETPPDERAADAASEATRDYEHALEYANAAGALASRSEGARIAPTGAEVAAFLDDRFA